MKHLRITLVFALAFAPVAAFAQDQGFVPLTNIQNLKFAGNQGTSLPDFLNSVYMLCIGLAAVIGVLQIMRAGVTWMTAAGSHEAIGNAKNLITQTIIGLILVLAPTIVFSIINPDILKLQIRGLSDLNYSNPDPNGGSTTGTTTSGTNQATSTGTGSGSGTAAQIVADFKGGATAPPSVIPNTIGTTWTPNPACKQIQDGQIISRTGSQETCCAYQQSPTASCEVKARSYKDLSSVSYCTCTAK